MAVDNSALVNVDPELQKGTPGQLPPVVPFLVALLIGGEAPYANWPATACGMDIGTQ